MSDQAWTLTFKVTVVREFSSSASRTCEHASRVWRSTRRSRARARGLYAPINPGWWRGQLGPVCRVCREDSPSNRQTATQFTKRKKKRIPPWNNWQKIARLQLLSYIFCDQNLCSHHGSDCQGEVTWGMQFLQWAADVSAFCAHVE